MLGSWQADPSTAGQSVTAMNQSSEMRIKMLEEDLKRKNAAMDRFPEHPPPHLQALQEPEAAQR